MIDDLHLHTITDVPSLHTIIDVPYPPTIGIPLLEMAVTHHPTITLDVTLPLLQGIMMKDSIRDRDIMRFGRGEREGLPPIGDIVQTDVPADIALDSDRFLAETDFSSLHHLPSLTWASRLMYIEWKNLKWPLTNFLFSRKFGVRVRYYGDFSINMWPLGKHC
uniref:Uncharacterized protein n=1 Tax=Cacopsylla melanoneura TaxID=428564 RepID=A0A8D9AJG5_9HEMI